MVQVLHLQARTPRVHSMHAHGRAGLRHPLPDARRFWVHIPQQARNPWALRPGEITLARVQAQRVIRLDMPRDWFGSQLLVMTSFGMALRHFVFEQRTDFLWWREAERQERRHPGRQEVMALKAKAKLEQQHRRTLNVAIAVLERRREKLTMQIEQIGMRLSELRKTRSTM